MSLYRLLLVAMAALLIAGATDAVLIARTRWQGRRRLAIAASVVPALIVLVCLVTIVALLFKPNVGNMRGLAIGAMIGLTIVSSSVAAAAGLIGAWLVERWRGR